MAIPIDDALRLLHSLINHEPMSTEERQSQLRWWMKEGITLTPELDLQETATLARILSGERYEI